MCDRLILGELNVGEEARTLQNFGTDRLPVIG